MERHEMKPTVNMVVLAVLALLLAFPSHGQEKAKEQSARIVYLEGYLEKDEAFQQADFLGKLKHIEQLYKDKRIIDDQATAAMLPLITQRILNEAKEDPIKALEIWNELLDRKTGIQNVMYLSRARYEHHCLAAIDKKQPKTALDKVKAFRELEKQFPNIRWDANQIQQWLDTYIRQDADFKKADLRGKIQFIVDLKSSYPFVMRTPIATELMHRFIAEDKAYAEADTQEQIMMLHNWTKEGFRSGVEAEVEALARRLIEQAPSKHPDMSPSLARLTVFGSLYKQRVVSWGTFVSATEERLLEAYILTDPDYQKMNDQQRLDQLDKLRTDGVITTFSQAQFRLPITLKLLSQNKAFQDADAEGKKKILQEMRNEGKLHVFNIRRIQQVYGL